MYMIKEKVIYNSDYINVITLGQRVKDSKSNLGLVNWDKFDHIRSVFLNLFLYAEPFGPP